MPTQPDPVNQIYIVAYDGQTPKVGVEIPSPFDPSRMTQDAIEITDPDILADIEALQAKVATWKGLARINAPKRDVPQEVPPSEVPSDAA